MREILFRGKLKGIGNCWAYGNLNVNVKGVCIITPDDTPVGKYGQVFPDTVGQFTGFTDINGNKIFEGDILKGVGGSYRVYFDTGFASFEWAKICGIWSESFSAFADEYEIIGNIYDNPELLKGGAE